MHGIMFAMGYTLSAWIGFGCYFVSASGSDSSFAWRFPLAFQAVPAMLLLACSPWLPFSPRWLVSRFPFLLCPFWIPLTPSQLAQNRADEAHAVIRRLHHTGNDASDALANREFYQMKKQLDLDRELKAKSSTFELFKTAPNRRRAYCGFSLMFLNMFTGVL